MAWESYDGVDYEIFLRDGASVPKLTDNSTDDRHPRIHNGQVVWTGYDLYDEEIFYFDARADLSLHVLQVSTSGSRSDPLEAKVVIRNRGSLPATDFYLDIYRHLL
jgi:hypothetical protein